MGQLLIDEKEEATKKAYYKNLSNIYFPKIKEIIDGADSETRLLMIDNVVNIMINRVSPIEEVSPKKLGSMERIIIAGFEYREWI